MNRKSMLLIISMMALGLALSGCDTGPAHDSGNLLVKVRALTPKYDITDMTIQVQPANIEKSLEYVKEDGSFTGTLIVPVGDQEFRVQAWAGEQVVGEGRAAATIAEGKTTVLSIKVIDTTGPAPQSDMGPLVFSMTASATDIETGQPVELVAEAGDPDGDPMTYLWTSDCEAGVFSDPAGPTTTWTLPVAGSCELTLSVSANGLTDSESVSVMVFDKAGDPTGGVQVEGEYIEHPSFSGMTLDDWDTNYYCEVWPEAENASCADAFPASEDGYVYVYYAGEVDQVSLSDNCGGTVLNNYTESTYAYFHWQPPAEGGLCVLTARIGFDEFVAEESLAVYVDPAL